MVSVLILDSQKYGVHHIVPATATDPPPANYTNTIIRSRLAPIGWLQKTKQVIKKSVIAG